MMFPTSTAGAKRSAFIRKAHEKLKRRLKREHRCIVGRVSRNFVAPIPARLPKVPTTREVAEYW
jgi:hypothetical protein